MSSPFPMPRIGDPLPRAVDAYYEIEKWTGWILADHGHGPEWTHAFRIELADRDALWSAIAVAVLTAPVQRIIDHGGDGLVCGVGVSLTIGSRSGQAQTAWHYAYAGDRPRLVTAYPTL